MIQLALRSSIQADVPFGVDEVGQDRRQRDGRDHQLEPGEEHPGPEHGEQRERRSGDPWRECIGAADQVVDSPPRARPSINAR